MNVKILAAIATTAVLSMGTGCGATPASTPPPGRRNPRALTTEFTFEPGSAPEWTTVTTLQLRAATEFFYRCDGVVVPDMTEPVSEPANDGGYAYSRTLRVRLPEGQTAPVTDHCEWRVAGVGCSPQDPESCKLMFATTVTATPTSI